MSKPLWFSLQGARRRVIYVTLYEGIAIAVVTLAFWLLTEQSGKQRQAAGAGGFVLGHCRAVESGVQRPVRALGSAPNRARAQPGAAGGACAGL